MILHQAPAFCIYFGSAEDDLTKDEYLHLPADTVLLEHHRFAHLKKRMDLDALVFLKQVHSSSGLVVDDQIVTSYKPFSCEGDFLTTNIPHVGIGVMTADCLPIIFYDSQHAAIAIAHAGWRGSVDGIAAKTFALMQEQYGTKKEYIRIFFGPSAKVCCYEVDETFVSHLDHLSCIDQVIIGHGDALHFDLPGINKHLLLELGIPKAAFIYQYNICTMCNDQFSSHRRQGEKAGRQMTVIALK